MKYGFLILLVFYPLASAISQGCFIDGFARLAQLENSGVEFPKRNKMIQESLLGCKAPDFTVKTITGEPISLDKLKGKVVVINFWFTSCAPCIVELPALNKLVEEFKGSEVIFIALARDDTNELADFLKKRSFNFNIVASANSIAKFYCVDIFGWPTSMIVDKGGIVRKIASGGFIDEHGESHIENELSPVIKKYLD